MSSATNGRFYRSFYRVSDGREPGKETLMRGYVARKGDRWYAVVYEGLDPVTGKERPRWHPAGTTREDAEELAGRLAAELNGRNDTVRSLTFGAYLTGTWLLGKKITLAESTWDGTWRRCTTGCCIPPTVVGRWREDRPRGAFHHQRCLNDAVKRGLVNRNVALIAHAPKLRSIPKIEPQAWDAQQLQAFLQAAAGHRLFPAFWLLAATGMRRSELLGLRWNDVDFKKERVSVNRGLVAVAYELRESRGKTPNSRRAIDLDPTTVKVLMAWKEWQQAEQEAAGFEPEDWVFANTDGKPIHPHSISQTFERIANRAGVPRIRLHDIRHTHGTLLIKAGVPVKVVSERLGHGNPAFTIDTYQHVLPGMQAEAARTFEQLINESRPGTAGRSAGRRTA